MRLFSPRRQWRAVVIVLVPFVLLDGFLLFTDDRWVGELGWTVDWANGGLYLASSLLAGLTAFVTGPYVRASRILLGVSRVAVPRLLASLWLWTTALALSGHALVVAVALTWTATTGPTDAVLPAAFGYSVLSTPLATAAGVAFGAMMRSRFAPPVALAVTYLAAYSTALGTLQLPFMVGGQFTTMVGLSYDPGSLVQYVARTTGFVILLGGLASASCSPRRVPAREAGILATSLALVAAAVFLPVAPDRIRIAQSPSLVCQPGSPIVCVAAGHTRRLVDLGQRIAEAEAPLVAAGIAVVTRLDERAPSEPVAAGHGVLDVPSSDLNALRMTAESYATAVTLPADCADYLHPSAATDDLLRIRTALAGWVLARLEPGSPVVPGVASLPDSWARAAYGDLRRCDTSSGVLASLPS